MATVTLDVFGMACGGCAQKVKEALEALQNVHHATVSLDHHCVDINYTADSQTNITQFQTVIEDIGFDTAP